MGFRSDLDAAQARLRALEEEVAVLRGSGGRESELEETVARLQRELREADERERNLRLSLRRSTKAEPVVPPAPQPDLRARRRIHLFLAGVLIILGFILFMR